MLLLARYSTYVECVSVGVCWGDVGVWGYQYVAGVGVYGFVVVG